MTETAKAIAAAYADAARVSLESEPLHEANIVIHRAMGRKIQRAILARAAAVVADPALIGVEPWSPPEDSFGALVSDSRAEAEKAMRKFPQPNYVISKFAEEAGEVVKAAIHCAEGRETPENLRGEMKQAVAMLYRLWIEGDQVHGLAPISTAFSSLPAVKGAAS